MGAQMLEVLKADAADGYNRRLKHVLWLAVAAWIVVGNTAQTTMTTTRQSRL
jgi:hypothetical protein